MAATPISKKTPVTIGLVVIMCIGCAWVGNTYRSFGNRIENLERAIKGHMESNKKLSIALHDALKEHNDFKIELERKTRDRWAKINDYAFMQEYSRLNHLRMVPHERVFSVTIFKGATQ